MILTAHQPVYLPWLGLFHKIALADEFVFFDQVQYLPKDWMNRNKIKTQIGSIWLTVPVLRKGHRELKTSGINTKHTMFPNFSWSCSDITKIQTEYDLKKYIILFPFCSPHLSLKKWPYYNELIKIIKDQYKNEYKILVAPGPNELNDAKEIDAISVLDGEKALDITQLSSLITNSSFIIANDTGPAHMAAHLNVKGITLFGSHTTAHKVSIEREKFKPIQVEDLKKLSADKVFEKIKL